MVKIDGWSPDSDRPQSIHVRHGACVGIIEKWGSITGTRAAIRNEGWTFTGDKLNRFITVDDTVYGVGEGESWEKDVS